MAAVVIGRIALYITTTGTVAGYEELIMITGIRYRKAGICSATDIGVGCNQGTGTTVHKYLAGIAAGDQRIRNMYGICCAGMHHSSDSGVLATVATTGFIIMCSITYQEAAGAANIALNKEFIMAASIQRSK